MTSVNGLLAGICVVDLSRILAGPYCTMILGDLGADVIKIERPEVGDDTRHWGPPFAEGGESAYFLSANRNKRSMTLNLKTEGGLEILRELIKQGDVLVENFRAGTLERWGLDYQALQELRPGLIYCTITGYGSTGPYRDRPGYDFIVQAMGGFMSVTGPKEGPPYRAGVAIADLAAGMFAANAILASLYRRQVDGRGQHVDLSLFDSQVALMSYVASNYLISGKTRGRYGNAHPNIVPYEAFKTRDGYLAFAAGNDRQWKKFCLAVDRPSWADGEEFATNPKRLENRDRLVDLLNDLFSQKDTEEWLALLQEIGLPAGPINDMDEVFADPQIRDRKMQVQLDHPTAGELSLLASPLNIPTEPVQIRCPPPTLGQHTRDILQGMLSYSEGRIESLRRDGVI